jgi:hypothetical protein
VAYLAWLRRLSCVACLAGLADGGGPIEACHPKFGLGGVRREFGLGERSHDDMALPLCRQHHTTGAWAEHRGQRRFWDRLGVDVRDFALDLNGAYARGEEGADVVMTYVGRAMQCLKAKS